MNKNVCTSEKPQLQAGLLVTYSNNCHEKIISGALAKLVTSPCSNVGTLFVSPNPLGVLALEEWKIVTMPLPPNSIGESHPIPTVFGSIFSQPNILKMITFSSSTSIWLTHLAFNQMI